MSEWDAGYVLEMRDGCGRLSRLGTGRAWWCLKADRSVCCCEEATSEDKTQHEEGSEQGARRIEASKEKVASLVRLPLPTSGALMVCYQHTSTMSVLWWMFGSDEAWEGTGILI